MGHYESLVSLILQGASDANISFEELCHLLKRLGFEERIRGSHHIFRKSGIVERLNLQRDGHKAKPYQVRQVRAIILKYKIGRESLMHMYEIIIYWSDEDQVFIADVPELSGCMAHGDSPELALANAKQAMQLWIDTAKEFGDPIPEPKGARLMLA